MLSSVCNRLAHRLSDEPNEKEQVEVITFGLELIFSELSKLIILLLLGYFLNVMLEVIIITVVFSSFRMLSGGVHLDSFLGCLLLTLTSVILLAVAVKPLASVLTIASLGLSALILYVLIAFLIVLRVPVTNKNHPITLPAKIRYYKKTSFFLVTLVALASLGLLVIGGTYITKVIVISAFMGLCLQSITLLPFIR